MLLYKQYQKTYQIDGFFAIFQQSFKFAMSIS